MPYTPNNELYESVYLNRLIYLSAIKQPNTVPLTPREMEVALLIGQGFSNTSINNLLFIEMRTVERHVGSIINKYGLTGDIRFAARVAIALKIVELITLDLEMFDNAPTPFSLQTAETETPKILHFR